ncbi:hypothetical protein Y032_0195g1510 [Ancylostoma ceylanicum]|uniref:CAAX prenyl protease 2 n=1 Tax=Ancylostoma ceylanicum TaxID=53326 RepID=A0A016SNU6_9BILA|nr:hypothetical protein Y032_0195g1510 [Ancylostoma ceylanicum]
MGCGASISLAVLFPLSYVGLLHIADHDGTDRNDPRSIRKRFIAATVNNVLSVAITYVVLSQRGDPFPLRSMGFRAEGIAAATILPAVLVTVLYTGQWMMMFLDGHLWSNFSLSEWRASFNRPTWIRDAIMAPITEEIAFRCCCASLLSGCLSPLMTIIVCPLPFASSHFHHIGDDRRRGFSLSQAIARRTFQFAYTYAFGAYATYLFLTTGHALAPIVTHAMCNSLGLPMFTEIGAFAHKYQRVLLWTAYIAGMCGFTLLVGPLTRSELYQGW